MRGLDGKVAIVTGATGNTGHAIARRLTSEGAAVIGIGRRAELGDDVAARVRADGGQMEFVVGDVGVEADVADSVRRALDRFGRVDIVVNNAASTEVIAEAVYRPLAVYEEDLFDRVLKVGLYGPLWYARHAIPPMIEQDDGGAFVNISSVGAVRPHRGLGAYNISKAGLEALTRQLAVEYGEYDIRANAIRVGSVNANATGRFSMTEHDAGAAASRVTRVTKTPGTPDDIASMTAFLASDEAKHVTGAVFALDGGITAARGGISPAEVQLLSS